MVWCRGSATCADSRARPMLRQISQKLEVARDWYLRFLAEQGDRALVPLRQCLRWNTGGWVPVQWSPVSTRAPRTDGGQQAQVIWRVRRCTRYADRSARMAESRPINEGSSLQPLTQRPILQRAKSLVDPFVGQQHCVNSRSPRPRGRVGRPESSIHRAPSLDSKRQQVLMVGRGC